MGQLNTILAQVFSIDESTITDSTSPQTVESWDSFNALILVTELEEKFKVKFTMEEITSVQNVGDIKSILRKHGANF